MKRIFKLIDWFKNLPIRSKLLVAYSSLFTLILLLGSLTIYWFIQNSIETNARNELKNSTAILVNMVKSTLNASVKHSLWAIAKKNKEIITSIYLRSQNGEMTEAEAKKLAEQILLSQTIGQTGYLYCIDSYGVVQIHPQESLRGTNISNYAFVQEQIQRNEGYLEYNWKNPGETAERPKALYMTYFAPWDWIISASAYRDEFISLVSIDDLYEGIHSVRFGQTGYVYVMDTQGNLLIHPQLQGTNILDSKDTNGRMFIQEIIQRKTGEIIYPWQNPGEPAPREKLVVFDYIPEYAWIVASTSYLNEVYAPLVVTQQIVFATIILCLCLMLILTIWLSGVITYPLQELTRHFSSTNNDLTVRLKIRANDEIGQLVHYFNEFMARLESYYNNLQAEIGERERVEAELRKHQEHLRELVEDRTQQLTKSERRLGDIINFLPDATIVIDREGKIIAWNHAIEEMTGIKAADMLGKDNYEYALPFYGFRRPILIDMTFMSIAEVEAKYTDIIRNGDVILAATAAPVNLRGKQAYLIGKACALRDSQGNITGAIESIRDVTTQHEAVLAQSVLMRYQAGLANCSRTLLENGEDDVIIPAALKHLLVATDASRVYIFQNFTDPRDGLCMLMQYEVCAPGIESQMGKPEKMCRPYIEMETLHDQLLNHRRYGGLVKDLPAADRQIFGPQGIVSLLVLPIEVLGKWFGFIGFDDCVHQRDWMQEDLRLLQVAAEMIGVYLERKDHEQMIQANEFHLKNIVLELSAAKNMAEEQSQAAEAANRAKSTFLANMSHELRTPLNAILGFSELLYRSPNLTSSQRDNLNTINQSGEHLLEIINDILEITKIETGRNILKEEDFDFYKLLDSLKNIFKLQAQSKGLVLHFECAEDVARMLHADQTKLRQVLMNLLSNAIKYTEAGQVSLRVCARHETDRYWLDFAVDDSGMGIAPEEMHLLFTPFAQTASGRKSLRGTGLGLAICQAFVKTLGGEISAHSQMGKGSSFRFSVPVECLPDLQIITVNEHREVVGLRPDAQAPDGGPYRLLVVEDIATNRELLVRLLTDFGTFFPARDDGQLICGFEMREANDGQQAVEIWTVWKPHLIWMDLRMPVMNGIEALQKIREAESDRHTMIIALTASAFEDDRLQVIAQGFDGYVRKPFHAYEIAHTLETYLGVNFVYAEQAMDSYHPGTGAIEETALVLPPELSREWMSEMEQALAQGDLHWMRDLAQQFSQHDAVNGKRLSDLINSFELDALGKLLGIQLPS